MTLGPALRVVVLGVAAIAAEAATVRGEVVDSRGKPLASVVVDVVPDSLGKTPFASRLRYRTAKDGTFEISNVKPGAYLIRATANQPKKTIYWVDRTVYVEVGPAGEPESVRIVMPLERGYKVSGRLLGIEDNPDRLLLVLASAVGSEKNRMLRPVAATVRPDGTFTLNFLAPADYQLRLAWMVGDKSLPPSEARPLGRVSVSREDVSGVVLHASDAMF